LVIDLPLRTAYPNLPINYWVPAPQIKLSVKIA